MQFVTIRLSVPILLFILVWFPELRLTLGVIFGEGVDNAAGMKLVIAFLELLFIGLKLVEEREIRLPAQFRQLLLPAMLWLAWMVLAAMMSGHLHVALLRTAEWLTHALFFTVLVSHLYREPGRVKEVIHAVLAGFALVFVWSAYGFSALDVEWFAAVPGFSNIRHFGHFALVALLLAMTFDTSASARGAFLFRKAVMVAAWTALFMASGRGPFFAIAVVTLLLVVRGYFANAGTVLATFAIGALIGLILSLVYSSPEWGVYRMVYSVTDADGGEALSSDRLSIWKLALTDVLHHPLFGLGPEGYLYGSGTHFHGFLHPHNFVLQSLVEWGIPGTLLFALILVRLLWPAYHSARAQGADVTYKVLFWAIAIFLVYSLVTGNLYIPFSLFLFVVCLALITARADDTATVVVKRGGVIPLYLLLTSLLAVQIFSLAALVGSRGEGLSPMEQKIVKSVPAFAVHPMVANDVIEWARASAATGNEAEAMRWLDWGGETLPRRWLFSLARAELLAAAGRYQEALHTLPAEDELPPYYREQLECIAARIAGES